MSLLDKLQYKRILSEIGMERTGTDKQWQIVFDFALPLFPELHLKPRRLGLKDRSVVYQFGTKSLFHIRAFSRKHPDTFIIIVTDEDDVPKDHILLDIGAEYSELHLECPQVGFSGAISKDDISRVIPSIDPHCDDPFAVLAPLGSGTYLQTYREKDGFLLEYQLVNTSSHYAAAQLISERQVVKAMMSYAFGKDEWLEMFTWKRIDLY